MRKKRFYSMHGHFASPRRVCAALEHVAGRLGLPRQPQREAAGVVRDEDEVLRAGHQGRGKVLA